MTDMEGKFLLNTLNDTCTILASWIGSSTIKKKVMVDSSINIILKESNFYDTKWVTIGAGYDIINSDYGLSISNGYDEQPLIHFEDFQEPWVFKISGTTDFKRDYSLDAKFGRVYFVRHFSMPTLEIKKVYDVSSHFVHTDVNLSTEIWFSRFPGTLLFKTGYQSLNGQDNLGAGIGWQNSHWKPCYGIMLGYWMDYFTYRAYIQSFIYQQRIGLRAEYERIDNFDFLTFGIYLSFRREVYD
jgi:hypothetical protein